MQLLTVIELQGLTKHYGSTVAVDDLTATVEPGVVTGFLGPNGAGKSTTMRLILGLDRPSSGSATIAGRPYRSLHRPLHQVGALLDARQFQPARTVRAHLRWIAAGSGISRARVDEVLGQVGLESVAGRRAGTLSLGMCQRLGIAGALLGDPAVLMFDEPVNGLDPEGIRWVRTLMRDLAAQGRTVLVSSHLLSEMAETADRLLVIGRGRLVAATSVTAFIAGAAGESVRVRSPQAAQLRAALLADGFDVADTGDAEDTLIVTGAGTDAVGELAARCGVVLHELSARRRSLEQAYLEVTDAVTDYRSTGAREPS